MKALSATSNQLKELERLALMQMKELEEIGFSGQPLFPPGLAPSLHRNGYMSSLVAEKLQISAQCYGPHVKAGPSELCTSESRKPMLFWL